MATNTDTSSSGRDHTAPPPSNTSHPVFAVNNIKNFIPLLLDKQGGNYTSWVELFHIHACAHDVLDHIDASVPQPTSVDAPMWDRIDAVVKQWIYSTISKDLLETIIKPRATAHELWTHLEKLFQDDKHTTTTATLVQPAVDPFRITLNRKPPTIHQVGMTEFMFRCRT
ncbi:hypothetical protein OSB04_012348 [Centaurea solstitialis]|uniref:Gag protein n=1 Tax=Centaurea solstitialis TaxID=347529 RepID=A0AA38WPX5_9ASTR|nr:hypothetical protein OSB04_012348 [Centaurea solstitialis]